MERETGLEPATYILRYILRLHTKLLRTKGHIQYQISNQIQWSGKRDSNPQPTSFDTFCVYTQNYSGLKDTSNIKYPIKFNGAGNGTRTRNLHPSIHFAFTHKITQD